MVKRIYRLPRSAPNAPLALPRERLGLGLVTPSRRYLAQVAAHMVRCLNSPDSLGLLMRTRLDTELQRLHGCAPNPTKLEFQAFNEYPLLCNLSLLRQAGMGLDRQNPEREGRTRLCGESRTLDRIATVLTLHLSPSPDATTRVQNCNYVRILRAIIAFRELGVSRLGLFPLRLSHSGHYLRSLTTFRQICAIQGYLKKQPTIRTHYATLYEAFQGAPVSESQRDRDLLLDPTLLQQLPPDFADLAPPQSPLSRQPARPPHSDTPPVMQNELGTQPVQGSRPTKKRKEPDDPTWHPRPHSKQQRLLRTYATRLSSDIVQATVPLITRAQLANERKRLIAVFREAHMDGEASPEEQANRILQWDTHPLNKVITSQRWRDQNGTPVLQFLVQWAEVPCPLSIYDEFALTWAKLGYPIRRTRPVPEDYHLDAAPYITPLEDLLVTFEPTWNDAEDLYPEDPDEIEAIQENLSTEQRAQAASMPFKPHSRDADMAPADRVSPLPPQTHEAQQSTTLSTPSLIHFSRFEHWPGRDRPPATSSIICASEPGERHSSQPMMMHVCSCSGHYLGQLHSDTLLALWHRHQTSDPPSPDLPQHFCDQIHSLLLRYTKASLKRNLIPHPQLNWVSPSILRPLLNTVKPDMLHLTHPFMTRHVTCGFSTLLEEDAVFGAQGLSYNQPWVGTSIATPAPDKHAIHRALRWALTSCAKHANSTVYLLLPGALPALISEPPRPQLNDAVITHIAFFPDSVSPYPPFEEGHFSLQREAPHAPQGCSLIRISSTPESMLPSAASIRRAVASYTTPNHQPTLDALFEPHPPGQSRARFRPLQTLSSQFPTHYASTTPPNTALPTFPWEHFAYRPPVQYHSCGAIVYTDGSRRTIEDTQRTGAAVFDEGTRDLHLIHPGAHQGFHATILRAELAALYICLSEIIPLTQPLTIFTDSLNSIDAISSFSRLAHRDATLCPPHTEAPLVLAIAELLHRRAQANVHTFLRKVPSHVGIAGNEQADQGATQACEIPDAEVPYSVDIGLTHRPGVYWLGEIQYAEDGTEEPTLRHCRNLKHAVTDLINKHLPFAQTNVSVYGAALHRASECTLLASTLFSSSRYTHAEKRTVLQARTGTLKNRKRDYRYGQIALSPDESEPLCPLPQCGKPDSQGHMLGGCLNPHIHGMICARHNEAGRAIYDEIRHGRHAHAYCTLDVGSAARIEGEDLGPAPPRRSGPWLGIPHTSTPDLVIIPGLPQDHGDRLDADAAPELPPCIAKDIIEVEIGFSSDSFLPPKREQKSNQHSERAENLRQGGWNHILLTIMIGTTGALFNDLLAQLQQMGISPARSKALAHRLQEIAVHWAHKLVVRRRQLENNHDNVFPFAGGGTVLDRPPDR